MGDPATAARAVDPTDAIAHLGRLVLNFRLIAALLTVVYFVVGDPLPGLEFAIVGAGLMGFALLWWWDRLAPVVMRHPTLVFIDVLVVVGILLFTGPDGPFTYYALGSAFLAGVVYGWVGGMLLSGALVAGYVLVVDVHLAEGEALGFQVVAATPALYLLAGAGAAAVRGLLLRKAEAEAALAAVSRAAAGAEERARLAREMHDTLGKTLHGIALTAAALPSWVDRQPEQAKGVAAKVARAAEAAAGQARELITDLRSDRLEQPLEEAVRRHVAEWSQASGIDAAVGGDAQPGTPISPGSRYEVLCILKEALRNVERHAAAAHVEVTLQCEGDDVRLTVADDGVGLAGPLDLDGLAARGHFGLIGMQERAQRAGGDLRIARGDPHGTTLTVSVAAVSAADMVPPLSPNAAEEVSR